MILTKCMKEKFLYIIMYLCRRVIIEKGVRSISSMEARKDCIHTNILSKRCDSALQVSTAGCNIVIYNSH